MIGSFVLAVTLGFGLAGSCLAESVSLTAFDVETRFFAAPVVLEPVGAGPEILICIVPVQMKKSADVAILTTTATKDGACPGDVDGYFAKSDLETRKVKKAAFDKTRIFDTRATEAGTRLFNTYPTATSYSFLNPITGKQEFGAYCTAFTYLDPRVHKGDPELKLIFYKRKPTPEKLTSLDDNVTCGDINYAYENEIKTRAPTPRKLLADDTVAHDKFVGRSKTDSTTAIKGSNHQQGK